jgi:hypothetical protein
MATASSPTTWSSAALQADAGLEIVDNVLSYAKTTVGNPGKREQALFLSAVAMAYAVWENYVEQVAIEVVKAMIDEIAPEDVPERVRRELAKHDSWELTVHPGWRALWVRLVEKRAVGNDDPASYGMNTAGPGQVTNLFEHVGVDPFADVADPDRLALLVSDRGAIVHTAQPPSPGFKKADARGWRDYVKDLYETVDLSVQQQVKDLTGVAPW